MSILIINDVQLRMRTSERMIAISEEQYTCILVKI
jgi:hypothetical protein